MALPEPERTSFVHEGNELFSYRWPVNDRPRVLLIHGIGMGHWVYESFITALLNGDTPFDVTAVDLPGFGDAPKPQHALSMEHTADLVALSLTAHEAPSPLIVVGHSMGSQVAAELAARHPQLVDALVLVATTVNPAERSVHQQAKRMLQDLGTESIGVLARGALAYAQAGPRWFIEKLKPTLEHQIERTLPRIEQPTLVIRGSLDRVSPAVWARQITGLVPEASLLELEGHGHEAIIAHGEPAVQGIERWLSQLPPRA